ncbi:MAG: helix-turn-helix domain containing protein [Rickettsiales bacterium]|nr:helix-turn-helix domain containing protein [Rickettsiales bacterium]
MTADTNTKTKFIELRAKGHSFDCIAKELQKSKQTLINWSKEFEEEIANLKATELESLFESCFVMKEQRIKLVASNLKAIQEELEKRDLKDVSTEKLIDILMKNILILKNEYIEPVFKTEEEIVSKKKETINEKKMLEDLEYLLPDTQNQN